jgi:oxalate decarboxylase
VLAKNFGVPPATFANLPQKEKYIFNGRLPGSVHDDLARSSHPTVPEPFNYAMLDGPSQDSAGGRVWVADSTNFKASKTIAAALVEVQPGALRELHWHPNADEWQYYISGKGRMTVFASGGAANTVDFSASDVGYVPRSFGHYIENTGTDVLRFLEVFPSDRYQSISLRDWIANTPVALVADHLQVDEAFLRALNEDKHPVVPI